MNEFLTHTHCTPHTGAGSTRSLRALARLPARSSTFHISFHQQRIALCFWGGRQYSYASFTTHAHSHFMYALAYPALLYFCGLSGMFHTVSVFSHRVVFSRALLFFVLNHSITSDRVLRARAALQADGTQSHQGSPDPTSHALYL